MSYKQFEELLSFSRLQRYKRACNDDCDMAIDLYRGNIALSKQLYAVIGLFEVVLRNQMDRHFVSLKGPTWLEDAILPGNPLSRPSCKKTLQSVKDAIQRLGNKYDHNGLIAALTLGFWTNMFAKKIYPAFGNNALSIFPFRPTGTNYKLVFDMLRKINILRNRLAHHEPICFDAFGAISTAMPVKRFALIRDMVQWMGFDPVFLFHKMEDVAAKIKYINQLAAVLSTHPDHSQHFE